MTSSEISVSLRNTRIKLYSEILIEGILTGRTTQKKDDENFLEAVKDGYFAQHVTEATRGRGTDKPSILDLLFTSNEQCLDSICIDAPLGKSDHSVIKTSYQCSPDEHPDKILPDFKHADFKNENYARNRLSCIP